MTRKRGVGAAHAEGGHVGRVEALPAEGGPLNINHGLSSLMVILYRHGRSKTAAWRSIRVLWDSGIHPKGTA